MIGAVMMVGMATALAAPTASPLDALTWMTGSWSGLAGDMEMEELWLSPRGGLMLGVHRDLQGGKAVNYEFLRLEVRHDGVVYTSIPNGIGGTAFKLKSREPRRVIFENLAHDFPQRIIYWSAKEGELCARVEGPRDGKVVGDEWCWRRAR